MSEENKLKIGKINSHPQTEEHKAKRSLARKEYFKSLPQEEKEIIYKKASFARCK